MYKNALVHDWFVVLSQPENIISYMGPIRLGVALHVLMKLVRDAKRKKTPQLFTYYRLFP